MKMLLKISLPITFLFLLTSCSLQRRVFQPAQAQIENQNVHISSSLVTETPVKTTNYFELKNRDTTDKTGKCVTLSLRSNPKEHNHKLFIYHSCYRAEIRKANPFLYPTKTDSASENIQPGNYINSIQLISLTGLASLGLLFFLRKNKSLRS